VRIPDPEVGLARSPGSACDAARHPPDGRHPSGLLQGRGLPDSAKVVVACGDGTIRVLDIASGQPLDVLPASADGFVSYAGFSPDGNRIVATVESGNTGFVEVWSAELATTSLPVLERLASERVTEQLTPAQQQQYLPGG
jgi:Tol biopolymer transport system component